MLSVLPMSKKNKTKKQWQINWSYHWKMIVYSFLQTCSCCDFNPLLHGSPLTFKVVSHPYLNISTYLQSRKFPLTLLNPLTLTDSLHRCSSASLPWYCPLPGIHGTEEFHPRRGSGIRIWPWRHHLLHLRKFWCRNPESRKWRALELSSTNINRFTHHAYKLAGLP